MSENSKIEWTDHTFNPWIGCAKVSPGCAHCYAETLMDTRYGRVKWGKGQPRQRTSAANWRKPLQWNKATEGAKERPRVFCASLADWLDDEVPVEWLADLLDMIRRTPSLDWLLLTKRPENWAKLMNWCFGRLMTLTHGGNGLKEFVDAWIHDAPPRNVWIGVTVEDQQRADERIPSILSIPARVRFLSCEPLLEGVDFGNLAGINWVICGGESGPKAHPMHPDWARSLRDQCAAAGVPFYMKQMGGTRKPFMGIPADLNIRQFPTP
jgi:protein gp37